MKAKREKEAIDIYEAIHISAIKFEEKVFRKDYFLNYLKLLIDQNEYVESLKVIAREIDFIETSSIGKSDWNLYMMDLLLIYMISHNKDEIQKICPKLEDNNFYSSKEG